MIMAQWIIGGLLLAVSVLIIVLNWGLVIRTVITKKHSSGIPIFGAVAGMLALLVLPIEGVFPRYWWIPPVVDYGFAFSILGAIYLSVFRSGSQETQR